MATALSKPKGPEPTWNELRVLSINLAFKPLNLVDESFQEQKEEKRIRNVKVLSPSQYDPEYQVYHAHEVRARGFIWWLKRQMEAKKSPDIICCQELMDPPTVKMIAGSLRELGYGTALEIDPLNPNNASSPRMASGGLAIYAPTERFQFLKAGSLTFSTRIGMDHLARKGIAWAILKSKGNDRSVDPRPFAVITLHPQAYVQISTEGPLAGESAEVRSLRVFAAIEAMLLGGYPACIEFVHKAQLNDLKVLLGSLLRDYGRLIGDRIILTGDWNINSFAPATGVDVAAETDPRLASKGPGQNREYKSLLLSDKGLGLRPSEQPAAKTRFPFSWDPDQLVFASPLGGGKSQNVYQRIDHAFVLKSSKHRLRDLDLEPMFLHPFPELGPFWSNESHNFRQACLKEAISTTGNRWVFSDSVRSGLLIEQAYQDRLELGRQQFRGALLDFVQEIPQLGFAISKDGNTKEKKERADKERILDSWTKPGAWATYLESKHALLDFWNAWICRREYRKSSQLWKGLEYYGFDREKDVGARWFLQHEPKAIGEPHGFRMLNSVTDHFGLVSLVSFF